MVIDAISFGEVNRGLADMWDDLAAGLERLDPEDRAAKAMRRCAKELRGVANAAAGDVVDHATVKLRTGWGDHYLWRAYRVLESEGLARKGPDGTWLIDREAARERIPTKPDHGALEEARTPRELAAALVGIARDG